MTTKPPTHEEKRAAIARYWAENPGTTPTGGDRCVAHQLGGVTHDAIRGMRLRMYKTDTHKPWGPLALDFTGAIDMAEETKEKKRTIAPVAEPKTKAQNGHKVIPGNDWLEIAGCQASVLRGVNVLGISGNLRKVRVNLKLDVTDITGSLGFGVVEQIHEALKTSRWTEGGLNEVVIHPKRDWRTMDIVIDPQVSGNGVAFRCDIVGHPKTTVKPGDERAMMALTVEALVGADTIQRLLEMAKIQCVFRALQLQPEMFEEAAKKAAAATQLAQTELV